MPKRPQTFDLLSRSDSTSRAEAEQVLQSLRRVGGRVFEIFSPRESTSDLLVLVGDSAFILESVRDLPRPVPVLGVGGAGFGALTEVTVSQLEGAARRIVLGDFTVEEVDRIEAVVGGSPRGLALNEVALLASTPGQLVRHSLWIHDELIWRDRGDGVIVATPTGSTAYALSAGGPIVAPGAKVFSIVPICSSDQNRPLVVDLSSEIRMTDVHSASGVDLVLDGRERVRVARGEEVRLRRSDSPVSFVRLGPRRVGSILGKLKFEREMGGALKDAPPSAKFLYKLLEYEGPLTAAEMARESNLSTRTIRNALNYLLSRGIVGKETSLKDARQDVYTLKVSKKG